MWFPNVMNVPIICLCKIPQKLKCSRVRTIVYIEPKLLIPVSCEYVNIKLEIMAQTSSQNLTPKTQEMAFKRLYFSKFSGGACPRNPLRVLARFALVGRTDVRPPPQILEPRTPINSISLIFKSLCWKVC